MSGAGDLEGRVAIVTGAGGGIGAAVAMELARRGARVVVNDLGVDPLGTGPGDSSAAATVAKIAAAGGTATADTSSVTDSGAVARMVSRTVEEWGSVDILVNTAGVVPSGRLDTIDQPAWDRLVGVHLGGHATCIHAVLPVMERQGHGRVLCVTSGAGLQRVAVDTAVYGTAKRAISALTVLLSMDAPAGVTINALSPIALTRMVAGPAQAARSSNGRPAGPPGYGLDFGNMPPPEALAPVVAYLCSDATSWMNGRIVFTNGREATFVSPPRPIEAVHASAWRGDGAGLAGALRAALEPAAAAGATTGGSMPRMPAAAVSAEGEPEPAAAGRRGGSCAVVWNDAAAGEAVARRLGAEGWKVVGVDMTTDGSSSATSVAATFDGAAASWRGAEMQVGPLDAVIVVSGGRSTAAGHDRSRLPEWRDAALRSLRLHTAWSRAAVVACTTAGRSVSLVNVVATRNPIDTVVAAGVTQLTRCLQVSPDSPGLRCFSIEHQPGPGTDDGDAGGAGGSEAVLAELTELLCHHGEWGGLAAQDLTVGNEWVGLRSHPAAAFTATFGDPYATGWIDTALRSIAAALPPR